MNQNNNCICSLHVINNLNNIYYNYSTYENVSAFAEIYCRGRI